MLLSRTTPAQVIDVWQPRWRDKVVLIASWKVGTHNEITFSRTKSMPETYYLSGETIRACPMDTNGSVGCYAVPMDKLEILERM